MLINATSAYSASTTTTVTAGSQPSPFDNGADLTGGTVIGYILDEWDELQRRYSASRAASVSRLEELRQELELLPPPPEFHERHGFQQMARLPCYRGVRTR